MPVEAWARQQTMMDGGSGPPPHPTGGWGADWEGVAGIGGAFVARSGAQGWAPGNFDGRLTHF